MAKQTSPAVSQGEDTAGARGFFALPSGGTGPGVLVLHAWWGLNDTIRGVCTRLAAAGFVAFAPDLYHGQVADTIAGAEALGSALDANHQQAKAEIAAAAAVLDRLTGGAGIGVLGFSLGAYYALDLAAAAPEHIHSVVLFYGSGGGDFSASRAAYLGHFAANDPYEPAENVEALADTLRHAGRQATFHTYPGTGHWFFEPDRADAFDAAAAALAWERTLAFLQRPAS
jgi:carboxymethylenebutenolidase